MKFDDFKKVEKCYKELAKGNYNKKQVEKAYFLLPLEFIVYPSDKNERVAAIKAYFEDVFLKAIEKLLPNGR